MTCADLLALADRVEREEPSRELDEAIAVHFVEVGENIPPYTTSLDAAASLMPPGWEVFEIAQCYEGWRVQLWFAYDNMICAVAPTEPRARTAAALRARAQEARDE